MSEKFFFSVPADVDENTMQKLFLSDVSVNTVLFSYHNETLNVLLLRFLTSGHYMLPGGYVGIKEGLDAAALRTLKEMTGVDHIYLEQFYVAGSASRTIDPEARDAMIKFGWQKFENWITSRKISICYYAILKDPNITVKIDESIFSDIHWAPAKKLPKMLFDHKMIIRKAIGRLQDDFERKIISAYLMDETFTMPELQKLHEAVYQQKLTRSNFQRKMLNLNILERLGKKYDGRSHKAPYLYRFKASKIGEAV
jgi:8-oxo-dGTP diphosphatase